MSFKIPLVAKIQSLVDNKVRDIYAFRLICFQSAALNLREELKELLTHQKAVLCMIEDIKDVRRKTRRKFEVLVSWVSFQGEDTWKELKVLAADVPVWLIELLNSTERKYSVSQADLDQVWKLIKEQMGEFNQ